MTRAFEREENFTKYDFVVNKILHPGALFGPPGYQFGYPEQATHQCITFYKTQDCNITLPHKIKGCNISLVYKECPCNITLHYGRLCNIPNLSPLRPKQNNVSAFTI